MKLTETSHIAIANGGTLCGAKQTDSSVGRAHLPELKYLVTVPVCLAVYAAR